MATIRTPPSPGPAVTLAAIDPHAALAIFTAVVLLSSQARQGKVFSVTKFLFFKGALSVMRSTPRPPVASADDATATTVVARASQLADVSPAAGSHVIALSGAASGGLTAVVVASPIAVDTGSTAAAPVGALAAPHTVASSLWHTAKCG